MKLSEAILKGCEKSPEKAVFLLRDEFGRTCALGAALEGCDYDIDKDVRASNKCVSEILGIPSRLAERIVELNDEESLSREAIAQRLIDHNYDVEVTCKEEVRPVGS